VFVLPIAADLDESYDFLIVTTSMKEKRQQAQTSLKRGTDVLVRLSCTASDQAPLYSK
jgi:hypothetical protein